MVRLGVNFSTLKGRSLMVGLLLAAFLIAAKAGPSLLRTANAQPSDDEVTELRKALEDLRTRQNLEAEQALWKLFNDFLKGDISDNEAWFTALRWREKLEPLRKELEDTSKKLLSKSVTSSRWRRAWWHGAKAAYNLWREVTTLQAVAAAIQDATNAVRKSLSWHISWNAAFDKLVFADLSSELADLHLELMARELAP